MSEAAAAASTNTNTATVAEPVVAGGGDAPVSWDQLESVSNYRSEVAKKEATEELKAEKEAKKELGEPKDDKQSVKKVTPDKDKAAAEKQAEAKRLKVKAEDKELDLPLDAKVPVKIDGKLEEVSLQEALSRYSQQKHLDKIYQDFKKEKSTFENERGTMKKTMDQIKSLLEQGDLRKLVEVVAEPAGLDPSKVYKELKTSWEQKFEEAQALSPEERKAKALEEELSYYRQKQEAEKTRQAQLKETQELESKVEQVMQTASMDKETFVKRFDELVDLGYQAQDLSPEMIADYHKNMMVVTHVEAKLAEVNPDIAADQSVIEQLATLAMQTGATKAEIEAVIEELYTGQAEKKLAKKMNKSIAKAKAETPVKNSGKDPLFFDDI